MDIQTYLPVTVDLLLPMCDLRGARQQLKLRENVIKEQADIGAILAWDISRSGAKRREYRFLSASVSAWPTAPVFAESDLLRLIYGARPGVVIPFITGSAFSEAWNCDSGHTINLVTDQTLSVVYGTTYGRGRGRTPCITWGSAVDFLRNRKII